MRQAGIRASRPAAWGMGDDAGSGPCTPLPPWSDAPKGRHTMATQLPTIAFGTEPPPDGRAIGTPAVEVPIACSLNDQDRQRRGEEITRLFREGRPEARRLPDGYALRFPGGEGWAEQIGRAHV